MKTLFLLRHAKSDWSHSGQRDFDRPLNERGRNAALAMGREFRRLGLAAERIIASPSARTTETIALVAQGYGGRMPVDQDEGLYLASPELLLGCIGATDDRHARLLIVGHNPGLHQLALMLAAPGALRDRITEKFPTGALAEIALPVDRWAEVGSAQGEVKCFLRPRDLDGAEAGGD